MCPNCNGTAVCIGNVTDNAIVNIGCVGTCRPSGRLRRSISLWLERRNNGRLKELQERIATLEARPQVPDLKKYVTRDEMDDAINTVVDAQFRAWTGTYGLAVATTMAEVLGTFSPSRFWSRLLGTLGAVGGLLLAFAYVIAQRPASWYPLEPGWAETLLLNDNGYAWLFVIGAACFGGYLASRVGHWLDDRNNEERRFDLLASAQQAAIIRVSQGV